MSDRNRDLSEPYRDLITFGVGSETKRLMIVVFWVLGFRGSGCLCYRCQRRHVEGTRISDVGERVDAMLMVE
jgi:hypothetical protein